ncbi:LysR family transcriptional regulator [uncultured Ruminococcus sp.]|uniref:LysR family transcriptional regulator n=1 Tax=uncultured Ruminococcus sp. TaxID=165186 RepID=UPI0025D4E5C2|nr:LysR family transcriptional regulator [uncultured Ruminococcus sp.]
MLKQIRYFQSVVRLGSFTAAAEEHFISQSAISQQIKALEEELGVMLLERKKRSFTLTDAGEFFYKKSLVLVVDYDIDNPTKPFRFFNCLKCKTLYFTAF